MKENDEIENLFQSAFEDFSVEPPQEIKIAIDKKIEKPSWYKKLWVLLPVVILLLLSIGYFVGNPTKKDALLTASEKQNDNKQSSIDNQNKKVNQENHSNSTSTIEETTNSTDTDKNSTTSRSITEQSSGTIDQNTLKSKAGNSLSNSNSSMKEPVSDHSSTQTKSVSENTNTAVTSKSKKKKNNNHQEKNKQTSISSTKQKSKSFSKTLKDQKNRSKETPVGNRTTDFPKNNDAIANGSEKTKGNDSASNSESSKSDTNGNTPSNESTAQVNNSKTDSIINPNKGNSDDSIAASKTAKLDSAINKAKLDKTLINNNSANKWSFSIRTGPGFVSNKLSNSDYSLKENKSLFFNGEVNYHFKNNFFVTSGVQYNRFSSSINSISTQQDSTIIGTDSTTNPTTYIYSYQTTKVTHTKLYNQSAISIPLYIGYSHKFNDHFYLDGNAGILLSYQQAKMVSSDKLIPAVMIRTMGMKMCIRPQLRYQFGNFGVTLSSNFGYDLKPTLNMTGITRKRLYTEVGIGLFYHF